MRSRLAAVLIAPGFLGLCLIAADDRREERREREDRGQSDAPKQDPAKPADPKPAGDKVLTFKADIAPLFKDACAGCHSGRKLKAGLDVTSYDSVKKFVKGTDTDKSKICGCLVGKGAKLMPPKNPLAEDQIALVKKWVSGGAKKE